MRHRAGPSEDAERSASIVQPTVLPRVLTSFVGRDAEVAHACDALVSSRLVTLVGAAGCGKTRLALRVAETLCTRYEHGARWVELAPLSESYLVPHAVARVMGIAERPEQSCIEAVLEALRDVRLLLVLDNCEHLLQDCAKFIDRLMRDTGVSVLATSRESLGVAGEALSRVGPFPTPHADAVALEDLMGHDAVRLFADRARAVEPAFVLHSGNIGPVVGICRLLDCVPLAIEVAAANVAVMTPFDILERLTAQPGLMSTTRGANYGRHASLRAAFEWSHDLLSRRERVVLRRLATFTAGWSPVAAEAVCTGGDIVRSSVLPLVSSLVDKSMIMADTVRTGPTRYRMLATIRHHAREHLVAADEVAATDDAHLQYYIRFAEASAAELGGAAQHGVLEALDVEYDEIRSALGRSIATGAMAGGLRLAIALYAYWTIRDRAEEGLSWLRRLLERADDRTPLSLRMNALAYATFLAGFRGSLEAQVAFGRAAAELAAQAGALEPSARMWALAAQAHAARAEGEHVAEFQLGRQIVGLVRESGDQLQLGLTLGVYSIPAMAVGEYAAARAMIEEALTLLRVTGNTYRIAMTLKFAGDLARCENSHARALAAYEESLTLLKNIDASRDLASVRRNLGHVCVKLGDLRRAVELFESNLTEHEANRNRVGSATCLIGFASVAMSAGLEEGALRLLSAAAAAGGRQVTAGWAATRLEYEALLSQARTSLSVRAFTRADTAGRQLNLEQAAALARRLVRSAVGGGRQPVYALTSRERAVVVRIAQAKANRDIALELGIEKRTVEKHIANIRSKLNLGSRVGIAIWALDSGLVDALERRHMS